MSKSSGQLQPFLNTIIPHLQALQIPYIATSSYEAPDKVKVERLEVSIIYHSTASLFIHPKKHDQTLSTSTYRYPDTHHYPNTNHIWIFTDCLILSILYILSAFNKSI